MKNRKVLYSFLILVTIILGSCSKKTYPAESTKPVDTSPVSAKEYLKEEAKKGNAAPPKMIVVNDAAAKKTTSGKYYYELNGYRYWRNEKDGKYYLDGIFTSPKKKRKN